MKESDLTLKQQQTVEMLIEFYLQRKRPSLPSIMEDIEELAGVTGMFIGAESSAGYNDELVQDARKEVDVLFEVLEKLDSIRKK